MGIFKFNFINYVIIICEYRLFKLIDCLNIPKLCVFYDNKLVFTNIAPTETLTLDIIKYFQYRKTLILWYEGTKSEYSFLFLTHDNNF